MKILYQYPIISDRGLIIRIIQQNENEYPVIDFKRLARDKVYEIDKFGNDDFLFIKDNYEKLNSILLEFIKHMQI